MNGYDNSALEVANRAWNRILQFSQTRHFNALKQVPSDGPLFHYTTVDGLGGIIEGNYLQATSAYFLNDSPEILFGYRILDRVLADWLKSNPRGEESLTLGLIRDLRRSFGEVLLPMDAIKPIYVACFCQDDNLLSQWRAYG